jgi:N-acetylgalactosamine-6-sulfatase
MSAWSRRAFVSSLAAPAWSAGKPPNIVLILADDLGSADLSSYGAPDIATPNIDRIGQSGVRFTRFYSGGPECSPTRTALLTGRYPQRVGGLECAIGVGEVGRYDEAEWLANRGELGLPATEPTMAQMLKARGYDTACIGKWHLGYREQFSANRHGFDEYFGILGGGADYFTHHEPGGGPVLYRNGKREDRTGYTTDLITEEALSWLKRRRTNPFFLYLPYTAPHTPIQDPGELDSHTGTAPVRQGVRAVYKKMVERMDSGVGAVLAQLRAMSVEDSTLVIFTSDNGADPNGSNGKLRGRKSSLWEGGIRVPCLMRWPGVLAAGRSCSQVGTTMDLLPTILSATSASAPRGRRLDGVDLLPVGTGKREPFSRTLFWRFKRGNQRRKAVREGDLKLVIDGGAEELHDLSASDTEDRNLIAAETAAAARLRSKLSAWEKDVEAPRLREFRAGNSTQVR